MTFDPPTTLSVMRHKRFVPTTKALTPLAAHSVAKNRVRDISQKDRTLPIPRPPTAYA